jgi:hypothetical protein
MCRDRGATLPLSPSANLAGERENSHANISRRGSITAPGLDAGASSVPGETAGRKGFRPRPQAIAGRIFGLGRAGGGRSVLLGVWPRGSVSPAGRAHVSGDFAGVGNGADRVHHFLRVQPDHRTFSPRRRRLCRCQRTAGAEAGGGLRLRVAGGLHSDDHGVGGGRRRRGVQRAAVGISRVQAPGGIRRVSVADGVESAWRQRIRGAAGADLSDVFGDARHLDRGRHWFSSGQRARCGPQHSHGVPRRGDAIGQMGHVCAVPARLFHGRRHVHGYRSGLQRRGHHARSESRDGQADDDLHGRRRWR